MAISTLEEIFEGSQNSAAAASEKASPSAQDTPSEPAPEPEAKIAEATDKDQTADPKADGTGAKDGSPPSHEDEPADADGRLKALKAERKRRQDIEQKLQARDKAALELETRLKELEARLVSGATAPVQQSHGHQPPQVPHQGPAPTANEPDPWLDPEGAIRAVTQRLENDRFLDRVEMSQELMRSRFPDYDEVEQAFRAACASEPHLKSQLRASSFPAKFAYEQGKRLMALQEIGPDPAAFREKIEADIRAKIEAEMAEKQPSAAPAPVSNAKPVPPPPPSLAGVTSAAPRRSAERYEGPTPLDDILG